ncbi:MAG: DNA-deoxyinosine glycosylase [Clostridia bacterium]
MKEQQTHPFLPVYDHHAEILILGTFPSVKSRENAFYYGHPQNRFWKLLATLYAEETPQTIEEKTAFLLRHRIALWDVIRNCEIEGSADQSIAKAAANDIPALLKKTQIKNIYCNGKKAYELFQKFFKNTVKTDVFCLPSTSPANAAWTMEKLIPAWEIIKSD